MKEQIQGTGVRKWFGDDFVTIQNEANAVIEGFFGHYGLSFILSGCLVDGTTISPGIVGLIHADGFKLCRFAGATGVTFPIYLKPVKTEQTRQYLDGATKPIAYVYTAETSATTASGYLEMKADGSTKRFNDIIQDSSHRMVTDIEKTNYAGQAASAVETIRGGVEEAYNTLAKLKEIIPTAQNVDDLRTELRGGVAEAYNTMKKIIDYINDDFTYSFNDLTSLPEFQGRAELTTSTIDWAGKPERFKTLTAATELDASNLIVGKTIGLYATGAFALTFTSKFKKAIGSPDPSQSLTNYIQMKCIDATSGSEKIVYSIIYIA